MLSGTNVIHGCCTYRFDQGTSCFSSYTASVAPFLALCNTVHVPLLLELGHLIKETRPYLKLISKAKAGKLFRALLDDLLQIPNAVKQQVRYGQTRTCLTNRLLCFALLLQMNSESTE